MADESKTGGIISAFLVGAVAGAVLGVLFAPKAGKETRAERGEWVDDALEKSKEKLHKVGEELKHKKDQLFHKDAA